jgi:hypothetical protein
LFYIIIDDQIEKLFKLLNICMLKAIREFLKVFSERKKRENGVLEVEEWVQKKLLGSVNSSTDYTKKQVLKTAYSNSILNFHSIRGQLMPEWQLMTMGSACSGMGGNLLRNIQYECQRGNKAILPLKRTGPNSRGYMMKVYRSNETICKNWLLRKS